MSEDLRSNSTVYSTREVLQGLDIKVDKLSEQMAVIVDSDLPARMRQMEGFKERVIGVSTIGAVLGAVGAATSIVVAIVTVAK